jgi:hypothetical protein
VGASSAFESAFESSADNSAFEGRDGEGDAGHHNAEKEEEGEERGRRREGKERALRMPHLAARVEGVVCAGWPPWEGEVGMEVCSLFLLLSGKRGREGGRDIFLSHAGSALLGWIRSLLNLCSSGVPRTPFFAVGLLRCGFAKLQSSTSTAMVPASFTPLYISLLSLLLSFLYRLLTIICP